MKNFNLCPTNLVANLVFRGVGDFGISEGKVFEETSQLDEFPQGAEVARNELFITCAVGR